MKIIWTRDTRQSIQATEHEAGEWINDVNRWCLITVRFRTRRLG